MLAESGAVEQVPGPEVPPSMLGIPTETLSVVLSFVSLRDLLNLRLVCRQYTQDTIFDAAHCLWMFQDEELQRPHYMSARRLRSMLARFSILRCVKLDGILLTYRGLVQGWNGTSISPRYLCNLLSEGCGSNLERLELHVAEEEPPVGAALLPSTNNDLFIDIRLEKLQTLRIAGEIGHAENPLCRSLLCATTRLVDLALCGCHNLNDHDVEGVILPRFRHTLRRISINECAGLETPVVQSSILESLSMQKCINLDSVALDCPSLASLDLSHSTYVNVEWMFEVGCGLNEKLPRLKMLSLAGNDFLRCAVVTSPSSLERIDLSDCSSLMSINISCPSLEHLKADECCKLNMVSIQSFAIKSLDLSNLPLLLVRIHCPGLVSLKLNSCNGLESKRCSIICPSLRDVDIRGTLLFSPEDFCGSVSVRREWIGSL